MDKGKRESDKLNVKKRNTCEERFDALLQRFAELHQLEDEELIRRYFLAFIEQTLLPEMGLAEWKDLLQFRPASLEVLEYELGQEQ